eukprot:CAMPEP_0197297894 /NCGR_PEP_ID=MMETSP0890-20130614/42255_1 /TAXON_ID=44058 ORGANISM="Aureoumbra lagunensis, Strain CCMP1510" /NCGR_SAMPLE_ID=MMETSP0890 /ASSEMBLY_ACC=CAM_ASM_000533 /LENGTH=392 /DNA_ID=CAMNT_0042775289 /DNA_START=146 /DNA_END=1321 /DNA_ORIENTATION=-
MTEILDFLGLDRKRLLKALISIDRGEFRWSFLTPWVTDRELTLLDKIIIFTTFVILTVGLQHHPPQYVADFFSYTIGNQVGYRLISIVSSVLEIIAYDADGGLMAEDLVPDGYNIIFIIVNLYYVVRYCLNKIDAIAGILEPLEAELFERCFEPLGVGAYQYLKLLDRAEWFQTKSNRTALTIQGEPVDALYVSITGSFDVSSNGLTIASIGPFQIIGEAATLENLQSKDGTFHQSARATVTAEKDSVYIKWSHTCLFELQQTDEEFAKVIRLAIARTLSHKLKSARRTTTKLVSTTTPQNEYMPTSDVKLLQPLLAPDEERLYLACLAKNGWDDIQIAADFLRLANKQTSNSILIGNGDQFIALAQGNARVYDEQGVQVLKIQAPSLVGAE